MPSRGPTVLHVVLSLNPGGTERLVTQLVRRLQLTTPTAVCCLDQMGSWGEELAREGIPVQALHREPGFRPSARRRNCEGRRRDRGTGSALPSVLAVCVRGARARASSRACGVFTEHGRLSDAPPSRKRRLVNPVLAHAAHRIFSVSHDLRRHMIAEGLPASRIEVIPTAWIPASPSVAARDELRGELGRGPATVVLITVARLDPVKDLSTLVERDRPAQSARASTCISSWSETDPSAPPLEAAVAALGLTSEGHVSRPPRGRAPLVERGGCLRQQLGQRRDFAHDSGGHVGGAAGDRHRGRRHS